MTTQNPNDRTPPVIRVDIERDELGSGGGPHKPADDREEIYFEGSPMLRGEMGKLLTWYIIGVLLIAAPFIARHYILKQPIHWLAYLVPIVLGVICFLIPGLLIRATRYRITNYRIDVERGIFSKRIDTLELWHVDDVAFKQGIMDRIFGVGDVTILSDDKTTPKLDLNGLPNPRTLFDSLKQRVIAVKRQRGVIKMDTGT